MKAKYILIACAVIISWQSCKKGSTPNPALIVGTWYESKLALSQLNTVTSKTTDTTFGSSEFTRGDYFHFSAADTASVWQDGSYFTLKGKFQYTDPVEQGYFYRSYNVQGSSLILGNYPLPTCMNCSSGGGNDTVKILQLDEHNLVLQQNPIDTSATYKVTTTTYYTR
jgi:hypothetical protein